MHLVAALKNYILNGARAVTAKTAKFVVKKREMSEQTTLWCLNQYFFQLFFTVDDFASVIIFGSGT